MDLRTKISLILFSISLCQAQEILQQQPFQNGENQQTLIVTQGLNGQGIQVLDRATNRRLIDTADLREFEDDLQIVGLNNVGAGNNRLVAGLLDWLEKLKEKKRRKKEKKEEKKNDKLEEKLPFILPVPPPRHRERKEIHIHINNHIKKHDKHHKHKKHHEGHYEYYHEGHHNNDKYYHGKHSYPLLGHHFDLGDMHHHYTGHEHHDSSGDHHHGDGHDDFSGYESTAVARFAPANSKTSATKAAATIVSDNQERRSARQIRGKKSP